MYAWVNLSLNSLSS